MDFKQHIFCVSPLFLQTLGPWFPNEMQNLFNLKRELWATEQQSSYFSPQPRLDASDVVSGSEVAW